MDQFNRYPALHHGISQGVGAFTVRVQRERCCNCKRRPQAFATSRYEVGCHFSQEVVISHRGIS
jgi:hypothetical protein